MAPRSVIADARDVQRATELIELGARLQVLESETALSRERLLRLYKEIQGRSPPKGMSPPTVAAVVPGAKLMRVASPRGTETSERSCSPAVPLPSSTTSDATSERRTSSRWALSSAGEMRPSPSSSAIRTDSAAGVATASTTRSWTTSSMRLASSPCATADGAHASAARRETRCLLPMRRGIARAVPR